jgi:hypothetical protein
LIEQTLSRTLWRTRSPPKSRKQGLCCKDPEATDIRRHVLARTRRSLSRLPRLQFKARDRHWAHQSATAAFWKSRLGAARPDRNPPAITNAVGSRRRWKTVIGQKLKARTFDNQTTEAKIGVLVFNRMTDLGRPEFKRVARKISRVGFSRPESDRCNMSVLRHDSRPLRRLT